jgi:chromosome partitioning protein
VLLIDLDPQAHLTLSVGLNPEKLTRAVGDVLLANASLVSISRESGLLGLDIVPANQELALIDKLLYGRKGYEFHLQRRLELLGSDFYDYVLLDCPPSFGTLTLNALTAANLLLIPSQCETYAVQSLVRTIRLARLVQQKTNPHLSYQVLVTMYDRRSRLCRLIFEQMQQQFNAVLCQTVIEVDAKLKESPAFGQPITVYAPKTRGAQQYRALAKELTYPHSSTQELTLHCSRVEELMRYDS